MTNDVEDELENGINFLVEEEKLEWITNLKDEVNDLIDSLMTKIALLSNSPIVNTEAKFFCEGQINACRLFVKMLGVMRDDHNDSERIHKTN